MDHHRNGCRYFELSRDEDCLCASSMWILPDEMRQRQMPGEGGGGDLVLTMPGCVRPKVKDMGHFSASRE